MKALTGRLIAVVGIATAVSANVAAQPVVVVGTGDPNVDVPAVQAAVDQGGRVVLKGRFSFDAPPTVPEPPSILFSGAPSGMILVSKAVAITGTRDDQGEMTTIEGGINPFYVDAPGAHVTIRGLHFIRSRVVVINVVAATGLVIASNRIEGVVRDTNFASAIGITTVPSYVPPTADQLGQSSNISGTLWIANNDIDMQATSGNVLGIIALAVGQSPDKEADLYISGNNIRNSSERPINIYSIGGRAYIERNVITTTGGAGVNVMPSGDVIHIVGSGSFLVAHNTIDCQWTSGLQAAIRLQTRPGQPVSGAVIVDNDVNMSAPGGTKFGATSAAIEIRGTGDGTMVLNNRIHGRANFALSVASSTPGTSDFTGVPQNTVFLMNDLRDFTSAEADVFVDAGATNTIAVGGMNTVEDHGAGTVLVPVR